jgi:hypothetical protein
MRTKATITRELAALRNRLKQVPQAGIFGDCLQGPLLAQIEVIEYDLEMETITERYEDGPERVLQAALDAYEWLRNDGDSLSDDWKRLLTEFPLAFMERAALHLV